MSYVAIARKWRPRTFEDIAGQGHVTRTLKNAIQLDRVHHAFLFTGARGVGKTSAARVLARALNCEKGPTPAPCGECAACKEILGGSSPDVIEIDGASNNSVEDVRELRESVRYLPQRGRSKVYIVDEVHMLSKGAFNALLKTLEEPPAHVVFIFATTEPQKIPDTILSRVQRFDFKRIPETVVVDTLKGICEGEGVVVPDAGLRLIARAGEGSMRDSQSLLDRVISFTGETITVEQVAEVLGLVDRSLLYEMLTGMLKGEPDRCLDAIEQVYTFGYDLSEFTAEMLELIRNATLVGLSPTSKRFLDVADEERARLESLTADLPTDVFVQSFHVMLDVHELVARAPRPRMVLEMAVARLVSIRPARPVDKIVAQLTDLERRMRHGGVQSRPRSGGPSGPGRPGGRGDDEPEPARERPPPRPPPGPPPAPPPAEELGKGAPPWRRPQPPRSAPPPERPSPPPAEPPRPPRPDPAPERRLPADLPPLPPPPDDPPYEIEAPEPIDWDDTAASEPLVEDDVPVDPDDDAGPLELAPPPIPDGADLAARGHALQSWLHQGRHGLHLLAWDSVIVGAEPPVLQVWMAGDFQQGNAKAWADDPWVKKGLAAYFPGCTALNLRLRPPGAEQLTRKERRDADRRARIAALTENVRQDPLVKKLGDVLGARLAAVVPDDERPADLERIG